LPKPDIVSADVPVISNPLQSIVLKMPVPAKVGTGTDFQLKTIRQRKHRAEKWEPVFSSQRCDDKSIVLKSGNRFSAHNDATIKDQSKEPTTDFGLPALDLECAALRRRR
jgi:hypothetical protein